MSRHKSTMTASGDHIQQDMMQLTVKIDGKKRSSFSASANLTPSLLTAGAKEGVVGATMTQTPVDDVLGHAYGHTNGAHHAHQHTPTMDGHRLPSIHHPHHGHRVAYTPKKQQIVLYFNIILFLLCIATAVLAILGLYIDSILILSIVIIVASVAGIILSILYGFNLRKLKKLRDRAIKFVGKHRLMTSEALLDDEAEESEEEPEPEYDRSKSLLARFRTGDFHKILARCEAEDLKGLLPVVLSVCTYCLQRDQSRGSALGLLNVLF